ncbi:hypothetical protein BVY01_00300 [bacterium I07]|nr:hypothetical protein BVY01_00300 [bacterium I07]
MKKKKRSFKQLFTALFSFSILLPVTWILGRFYSDWLSKSESFQIRKIEIQGTNLISRDDLLEMGEIVSSGKIWNVDLSDSEKRIRDNPFVQDVQIQRQFPDILQIKLQEKKAIALINLRGKPYCIDRRGLILPSKPGRLYDLPIISCRFMRRVRTGQIIDDEPVQRGLAFLEMVRAHQPELYTKISELQIKQIGIELYTMNHSIPVKMGRNDYEWKIRQLNAILNELEGGREMKKVRYIDLRFQGKIFVGMRA